MQKLTSWIFTFVAAALLTYACLRYGRVHRELSRARDRLTELSEISARLREDNEFLSYQIGVQAEAAENESETIKPTD